MKNQLAKIKAICKRMLCAYTDIITTENKMDDKKNNFIIYGTKHKAKYIFAFKIFERTEVIKQEFVEEKPCDESNIGFVKK